MEDNEPEVDLAAASAASSAASGIAGDAAGAGAETPVALSSASFDIDSLLKLRSPLRLLGSGGSPCIAAAIKLIVN